MEKKRVEKGERYYFINALGEVAIATDYRMVIDYQKYEAGNYFTTKESAEAIASKLRAVLKGADVIEPLLDDDKFATEVTFNGDCNIIPPENHLIGTIVSTDRGMIVEFIKK